jgi:molecular chaperone DnaJ
MGNEMEDPYAVLGVARDATRTEIRRAYRELARRLHPDAGGTSPSAERLVRVNEAWRILSDPARRAALDSGRVVPPRSRATESDRDAAAPLVRPVPARFPWRAMVWLAVVGIVVVVVASVLSGPAVPPPPDQLLGPGSCVDLDPAGIAVEVACEGPHDATVVELVPFDGRCPDATSAHRDRQGLGLACLVAVEPPQPGS